MAQSAYATPTEASLARDRKTPLSSPLAATQPPMAHGRSGRSVLAEVSQTASQHSPGQALARTPKGGFKLASPSSCMPSIASRARHMTATELLKSPPDSPAGLELLKSTGTTTEAAAHEPLVFSPDKIAGLGSHVRRRLRRSQDMTPDMLPAFRRSATEHEIGLDPAAFSYPGREPPPDAELADAAAGLIAAARTPLSPPSTPPLAPGRAVAQTPDPRRMTVQELRARLRGAGLDERGQKAELVARLASHLLSKSLQSIEACQAMVASRNLTPARSTAAITAELAPVTTPGAAETQAEAEAEAEVEEMTAAEALAPAPAPEEPASETLQHVMPKTVPALLEKETEREAEKEAEREAEKEAEREAESPAEVQGSLPLPSPDSVPSRLLSMVSPGTPSWLDNPFANPIPSNLASPFVSPRSPLLLGGLAPTDSEPKWLRGGEPRLGDERRNAPARLPLRGRRAVHAVMTIAFGAALLQWSMLAGDRPTIDALSRYADAHPAAVASATTLLGAVPDPATLFAGWGASPDPPLQLSLPVLDEAIFEPTLVTHSSVEHTEPATEPAAEPATEPATEPTAQSAAEALAEAGAEAAEALVPAQLFHWLVGFSSISALLFALTLLPGPSSRAAPPRRQPRASPGGSRKARAKGGRTAKSPSALKSPVKSPREPSTSELLGSEAAYRIGMAPQQSAAAGAATELVITPVRRSRRTGAQQGPVTISENLTISAPAGVRIEAA